jgi:FG-GAP-like repeat/FG-GAP repeat
VSRPVLLFPANARPFALAIGDLNGDKIPDLAIANYSGHLTDPTDDRITVLLGSGDGTLRPAPGSPFKTGSAPTNVAVGDVNGDGIMDVAVGNYGSNNVTLLFGSRSGLIPAPYSPITVGQAPASIAVDDLNGDGKADIVTANSKDNTLSVLLSR